MERSLPLAARESRHRGLAYAVWLPRPRPEPHPGVVVVHGAGSRKENHTDFARLATTNGWAALTFDLPGHGASEPAFTGAAVDDVVAMVDLLATQPEVDPARVALRGSSLGGFLAICAASAEPAVAGVIAICPAREDQLARGVSCSRWPCGGSRASWPSRPSYSLPVASQLPAVAT